jgi:hypothetical protein
MRTLYTDDEYMSMILHSAIEKRCAELLLHTAQDKPYHYGIMRLEDSTTELHRL